MHVRRSVPAALIQVITSTRAPRDEKNDARLLVESESLMFSIASERRVAQLLSAEIDSFSSTRILSATSFLIAPRVEKWDEAFETAVSALWADRSKIVRRRFRVAVFDCILSGCRKRKHGCYKHNSHENLRTRLRGHNISADKSLLHQAPSHKITSSIHVVHWIKITHQEERNRNRTNGLKDQNRNLTGKTNTEATSKPRELENSPRCENF
ncbi:mediator of RNA polymerase II transcription subunit [Striga asiatica]|uniref:Mediator of RNA polymerase II transcription subunit n=1 Tax=Striga asiatica TaxID=4170 RepID=A0A5A7P4F8_STRAF|nr:mediator of RNA polymerase II transcription subunit [Striga asiatica]